MSTIIISVLSVIVVFLASRVYWLAKLSESLIVKSKSEKMKKENEVNLFKQIVGLLFTLVASAAGVTAYPELFASFGTILGTTYLLVNIAKPYLGNTVIQVFSWVIGILLSLGAWFLELGIFVDTSWIFATVTGFVISLAANGIYDAAFLESAWKLFKKLF